MCTKPNPKSHGLKIEDFTNVKWENRLVTNEETLKATEVVAAIRFLDSRFEDIL